MKSPKQSLVWLPLAIALSVIVGIIIGKSFTNNRYYANYDRKLNSILNLVGDGYVDKVDINEIVEKSIPSLLSNLDPHTTYLSVSALKAANDDLNGVFSGIGVQFLLVNDTVNVVEVIPGGPSEKAGLMAGDKIVSVNDTLFVGKSITNDSVLTHLRGPKGSTVKLGIQRNHNSKFNFNVTRGDIPVKSVDAAYMLDKTIGYIKVNQFGRNTYDEFITGLTTLKTSGAKKFIIDLRGNGGGFMEMAILMANEFLPENQLIVFTKGRDKRNDSQIWSDGNGSFKDSEVVVLIDEYSASASEIFAGALQDNDRGLIVGSRSFGKGLVQKQFMLPDSSAIRMTIARYYTPTGRSIQKDYSNNSGSEEYSSEVYKRYTTGELYSKDSIKIDKTKVFETRHGRKVYGGGGIIPDIFVARDTTGYSSYYANVMGAGLIQKYSFNYANKHRNELKKLSGYKQFLRTLPSDQSLLYDFVTFAAQNGVPIRWYYINQSRDIILSYLKALIARDIYGNDDFYAILNRRDKVIEAAQKAISQHKAAFPILPYEEETKPKKK